MITISIMVQQQKLQQRILQEEVQYIAILHTKVQGWDLITYIHSILNLIIIFSLPQHILIIIITISVVMMPIVNNINKQKEIALILTIQDEVLLDLNFVYD